MAGVYDIAEHLQYEEGRGVRYLSTMERALGGQGQFPCQSPSVILSHAASVSARRASPNSTFTPGYAANAQPGYGLRTCYFRTSECCRAF